MDVLAPVLDFKNNTKVQNAVSGSAAKDYATVDQVSGGTSYSAASTNSSTYTVGAESFLRGYGTVAIAVTIPSGRTQPITIKHVGTQDMTITFDTSTIDGNANIILRGGKKQSVTIHIEGGAAWIT